MDARRAGADESPGIASCLSVSAVLPLPPRAIWNRFGQVCRLDGIAARQVGDGAGQLEHRLSSARRLIIERLKRAQSNHPAERLFSAAGCGWHPRHVA
jgi:hypothetical protein